MSKAWMLLPILTACGQSLWSASLLEEDLGVDVYADGNLWEARWASEDGLVIDCELIEPEDDDDEEGLELGTPEIEDPSVWVETEHGRYALALLVLFDEEEYMPPDDRSDPGSLDDEEGVFGIAKYAQVFLEGGEELEEDLFLSGTAPTGESEVWVEIVPEVVDANGHFEGALIPVDFDDDTQIELEAIHRVEGPDLLVWSGEAVGGARAGCGEDE